MEAIPTSDNMLTVDKRRNSLYSLSKDNNDNPLEENTVLGETVTSKEMP